MKANNISTYSETPTVFYKAFEDNSGAIELVRTSKMRPRTKHINLVYHNFREYVRHRNIIIHPISTEEEVADMFTKPLAQNIFIKHRTILLQWSTHNYSRAPSTK